MARDSETGKTVDVPDMAYKEWKERYVVKIDGHEEYNVIKEIKGRPNKYVADKISSGAYGVKINEEKQKPHMESTAGNGKSYLFDTVDPQELFNKYAGTGIMERDSLGRNKNIERCIADFHIGVDKVTNTITNRFKIHHSRQRTHIVPTRRRK
ncbi:polymorphic toxin type 50 domain-containing protein [Negativicoccus succinicivorans]|uniref:polymorphic toxin type 50 domain-containing protein n=1 Tax=Negativicoccus succinicivorans TaxID=620903 RepID=UPI0029006786|nr:polymorphic toxin type 50 domain-containing protein [Negativicoccus succinicivorans]MDU2418058.1 polymorphic toxin type 50 domain-containing protein [Negativicoccus succinicivorans]